MHLQCFAQMYIDIGAKIIYFQCFVTTDMFLFCKPMNFSGNCRICRDLAFGSVKTCFKVILKKLDFSTQIDFSSQIEFSMNFCPQRATKLRSLQHRKIVRRLEQPQDFIKEAQSFKSYD